MIVGSVSPQLDATIPLRVIGPGGTVATLVAVVDTGFTGELTLPPAVIAGLGLPWVTSGTAVLADGSRTTVPIHRAEVVWHGTPRTVRVEASDSDPLVGMGLLADSTLFIDCRPGGAVEVRPRP